MILRGYPRDPKSRERLLAVSMAYEKNSLSFISPTLKRGTATISRWIKAYKEGGTKQLLKRSHENVLMKVARLHYHKTFSKTFNSN